MDERRKFVRIPFDKRIMLHSEAGESVSAHINNLCLKGASIKCDAPFEVALDDLLTFSIELSKEDNVEIKGTASVVWKKGDANIGLYFVSMGVDYFVILRRLVELNYADNEEIERELEYLIKK